MRNKTIHLNGTLYGVSEIQAKLDLSLPDWERAIFNFLLEWFSSSETIEVLTSGSTGTPKVIHREKKHVQESAMMTGDFFSFTPSQSALLCLPAQYIGGKMMLVRAIEWELELDYIAPKTALDIPDKTYHFSAMTPQQIAGSIQNISNIKTIIIGGAPINSVLEKRLIPLPTHLYATYGMTETVSHIALRKLTKNGNETYTALPKVSFSTDSNSCLIISAPTLLEHPITTTDIVKLIDTTSFNWIGRSDFIINSGGLKISPEKLEAATSHLFSSAYFFFGKPDEKWGHKVILLVEGIPYNTDRLHTELASVLSSYQVPKEIIFIPKFIRTVNGKLNRIASASSQTKD
jgi:O-succinylbenzoic acid--CoA ligase